MSEPIATAVIGGGLWGQALAAAASRNGGPVLLLSRRQHEPPLPSAVQLTSEPHRLREAKLVLLAVPSATVRAVAEQLSEHLHVGHYLVHGVRGLVPSREATNGEPSPTLHTVSEVLRTVLPVRRLGALGGPALAPDLRAGSSSVLVTASRFPEVSQALREVLAGPSLRLFDSRDLRGVEWASALVGCLAIAIGFAKGKGLSPGLIAALICRAIDEGARLTVAAGGDERTLLGLAGYGDLLASVEMRDRPEVVLGHALAEGCTVHEAQARAGARVEALALLPQLTAFAKRHKIESTLFDALQRAVTGDADAARFANELGSLS